MYQVMMQTINGGVASEPRHFPEIFSDMRDANRQIVRLSRQQNVRNPTNAGHIQHNSGLSTVYHRDGTQIEFYRSTNLINNEELSHEKYTK